MTFLALFGSLIVLGLVGLSPRLGQRAVLLAAGSTVVFVAMAIAILAGSDSYVQDMSFWSRRSGSGLHGIWGVTLAVDVGVTAALFSFLNKPRSWPVRPLILVAAASSSVFFCTLLLIALAGN